MKFVSTVKQLLYGIVLWLCFPVSAAGSYLTDATQLSAEGAKFSWEEARSKSVRIFFQYRDRDGALKTSSLGSGFLISEDGLFVTAYHVMKYCLERENDVSRFSSEVNCSDENRVLRYKARNADREFDIELVSHLREEDSINGKTRQTPDETIKHRDFVIAKLKTDSSARFPHWKLRDFKQGTVDVSDPEANFELEPLLPPKKVFIVGYPEGRDFVMAHGFLNLTEANRRGYFAANLKLYTPAYLEDQGLSPDTRWGIGVENHMSGGAVVDLSGFVIGVLVNGADRTTGVLSIENVLETFFSRSDVSGGRQTVTLSPTQTRLYLKKNLEN